MSFWPLGGCFYTLRGKNMKSLGRGEARPTNWRYMVGFKKDLHDRVTSSNSFFECHCTASEASSKS